MPPFPNPFYDALTEENSNTSIFDFVALELEANWHDESSENYKIWVPGLLAHCFILRPLDDDRTFLEYECRVMKNLDASAALEFANDFNRRALGVNFFVAPIEDQIFEIVATANCELRPENWFNLGIFLGLVARAIGICEAIASRVDLAKAFECEPALIEIEPAATTLRPRPLDLSMSKDPLSPYFAIGTWIAEHEAQQLHERNIHQVNIHNESGLHSYSAPFLENEINTNFDMRIGCRYDLQTFGGDENVFRGYNITTWQKTITHPELGMGIEITSTFPFFTSETVPNEPHTLGHPAALELCAALNYCDVLSTSGESSYAATPCNFGAWVANNDQIFRTTFVPATVLNELAPFCGDAFGFLLSQFLDPSNIVLHRNNFVQFTASADLVSRREPDVRIDQWAGCSSISSLGTTFYATPEERDGDLDVALLWNYPVLSQIACWGTFTGSDVPVATIEITINPNNGKTCIMGRTRSETKPWARVLGEFDFDSDPTTFFPDIMSRIGDMQWPRIDWLIVRNQNFLEPITNGVKKFATRLGESEDVKLISTMLYSTNEIALLEASRYQVDNLFTDEKTPEECFEWVITLPHKIDARVARIPQAIARVRGRLRGDSETLIWRRNASDEFILDCREGNIDPQTSFTDYLRSAYGMPDDEIQIILNE